MHYSTEPFKTEHKGIFGGLIALDGSFWYNYNYKIPAWNLLSKVFSIVSNNNASESFEYVG